MTRSTAKFTLKPLFLTLEGTEGSGKSSFLQALEKALKSRGIPCLSTREPGGAKVAEKIREILIHEAMHPLTELFLYEAARAEHLETVIRPALKAGQWVICDRFTDSTLAYQGSARGIDRKLIRKINGFATAGFSPNFTLFLDIDPAVGLRSAKDPNKFEREGVAFQEKVRKGFLKTIKEEPKRFIRMKGKSDTPEKMAEVFLKALEKRLKRKIGTSA